MGAQGREGDVGRGEGSVLGDLGGWDFPGGSALPLRTVTLPPATHTNAVFVGRSRLWVVDPGSPFDDGRAALAEALDALGRPIAGVVLTHHHPDHVGAAAWLRERLGVPVLAHRETAALVQRGHVAPVDEGGRGLVTGFLDEGAVLDGGGPADRWRVLHTPGHAPGHLVLWQPERRGLVAGDMVAAVGTIVVEPPHGDMAAYLASLERLVTLAPAWLVPAHGGLVEPAVAHLQHYIEHRLARERAVLAAVVGGASALPEITAAAYPELAPNLHALASRSAHAHLLKLAAEGRVLVAGGGGGAARARWTPSAEA